MTTVIFNARKVDSDGIAEGFWVRFVGSRITESGIGHPPVSADDTVFDAAGQWLTPGFIDLHCHGGGGHPFTGDAAEIAAGVQLHRRHGTTRTAVSLVALPIDVLEQSLREVAELARRDDLVLGSHLEGPFLSAHHHGAHDPHTLIIPTSEVVEAVLSAAGGTLLQVTIAPELPGALSGIETFVAQGVRVAIGHTAADYHLAQRAFDRGATILTHAFNAMPPIHHRAPGPIVAAFEDERVTLELILDGHHVEAPTARLAFRQAPGRIALVTDAMAAAGAGDGIYLLGDLEVAVNRGRAVLAGTDTLAGSTLTQDAALRYALVTIGLPPVEAVAALTSTPARAIGRQEDLGYLRPGYLADAVLLSAEWEVQQVWAGGLSQI